MAWKRTLISSLPGSRLQSTLISTMSQTWIRFHCFFPRFTRPPNNNGDINNLISDFGDALYAQCIRALWTVIYPLVFSPILRCRTSSLNINAHFSFHRQCMLVNTMIPFVSLPAIIEDWHARLVSLVLDLLRRP